ncbi:OmpP1/FadL family transporter [Neptunitalea lumnitzerae]|uniref:Transporter n=1 Tax=Neptunitalea lumnitzerae TaxID=2965509 RepID=A0ABQ5MMI4_9FLAO|nr:outer membrane protein transport protein [Neptunitalea sp. Y10]GLB50589.1 transporter [Neptunitalea sp. Y10]
MKKFALLLATALTASIATAQDINDALRYSSTELSGSARVRAMSGAFGALGGDVSAISINPAGSAVFVTSEIGLTIGNYSTQNENNFFNTLTSENNDRFDLSQGGFVFVLNNTDTDSDWKKLSFGVNYDLTNNYSNSNFIAGINPNNGIDQYFLAYANGIELSNLDLLQNESIDDLYQYLGEYYGFGAQQAFLGYQSYIIDPLTTDTDNTTYISNAMYSNGVDQEYSLETKGASRKFSFNFGAQYKDFLHLGLNLNSHVIDYKKSTYLSEIGFDPYVNSSQPYSAIQETGFENYLEVYGNGFSFQLGTIIKVGDHLRLGAVYDSPTWYNIDEELTQGVFGVSIDENGDEYNPDVIYPNIVNVYETYRLKTPGKLTGSLAYVFGKQGLLSFDYSRKDYSNIKFKPTNDPDFRSENQVISNTLAVANTYRVGGEYRIEQLSLRAGYRLEESPYKNTALMGDLTGYSFGLGYDFGGTKLDISYDRAEQDNTYQLYSVGLTDRAAVNNVFQNIMLTVNFKL